MQVQEREVKRKMNGTETFGPEHKKPEVQGLRVLGL